jgi:4-hydroxy-tetrahydrodipicolinate synthase
MNLFRGLSAFPTTPADADGRVQTDVLCRLVERIDGAGADSIGLLGSTGGYAYLGRTERRRAVEAAVECIGSRTPIIAGVGALRTDDAQALARDAEAAGADGILLAPMSYTPLTEDEVHQHFVAVAAATGLPLCIYNNPTTTRFTFSDGLIARLAEVENISAVKMPLPTDGSVELELSRLRALVPDRFVIGYSGDWGAADALLCGADTWFSVAAGLLPEAALKLSRAAQAGDVNETQRRNDAFGPLWGLFKEFGSFRVMYAVADILGLFRLDPPRPVLPLGAEVRLRVEAALAGLDEGTGELPA